MHAKILVAGTFIAFSAGCVFNPYKAPEDSFPQISLLPTSDRVNLAQGSLSEPNPSTPEQEWGALTSSSQLDPSSAQKFTAEVDKIAATSSSLPDTETLPTVPPYLQAEASAEPAGTNSFDLIDEKDFLSRLENPPSRVRAQPEAGSDKAASSGPADESSRNDIMQPLTVDIEFVQPEPVMQEAPADLRPPLLAPEMISEAEQQTPLMPAVEKTDRLFDPVIPEAPLEVVDKSFKIMEDGAAEEIYNSQKPELQEAVSENAPRVNFDDLATSALMAAPQLDIALSDTSTLSPGQCWVQTYVNPRSSEALVQIQTKDAAQKVMLIPADIRTDIKQVVKVEGGKSYRIEPPVYRTEMQMVLISPAITRHEVIPAVYEEREEMVEITPAQTIVEPCAVSSNYTGLPTFCTREMPAQTEVVIKEVLVQEESVTTYTEPAVYRQMPVQVIETPARAVEIVTGDIIEEIEVVDVVRPASTEIVTTPRRVQEIAVTQWQGESRLVSRQVLCGDNINANVVSQLQQALQQQGFEPGEVNGSINDTTMEALIEFQVAQGLAVGALTLESLQALSVQY